MTKRVRLARPSGGAYANRPPDMVLLALLEVLATFDGHQPEDRSQQVARLLEAIAALPPHAGELAAQALALSADDGDDVLELDVASSGAPRTPGAQRALSQLFGASDMSAPDDATTAGAANIRRHAPNNLAESYRVAERPAAYGYETGDEDIARTGVNNYDYVVRCTSDLAGPVWDVVQSLDGAGDEDVCARIERVAAALNLPRIAIVAALSALEKHAKRGATSQ